MREGPETLDRLVRMPKRTIPSPLLVRFLGGSVGAWQVLEARTVSGAALPAADRIEVCEGSTSPENHDPIWTLRGVASHQRYVERREAETLRTRLTREPIH